MNAFNLIHFQVSTHQRYWFRNSLNIYDVNRAENCEIRWWVIYLYDIPSNISDNTPIYLSIYQLPTL